MKNEQPIENTTPTGVPPQAPGSEAWRSIAVYRDGSGKAHEYYDRNIATIEEWEAVHRLHRAFIAKHIETLAGLYWKVAYLEAAIELCWGMYRGEHTKPADIARLWPDATWKRVKQKYSSGLKYDWEAVVDGITLRIEGAESEEPRPKLREGETIRLPNNQASDAKRSD